MPTTKSPLRYPGGKSQLSNYVEHLLKINDINNTYIEPFAGGFGVGLELLYRDSINNVVLNDLDPSIYSIWNYILNDTTHFLDMLKTTPVTIEEWNRQKAIKNDNSVSEYSIEKAFASFFLNRANISGIINGGPIGGKNQNSKYKIDCRFNKTKLIEKIKKIASYNSRIELTNLDANHFILHEIPKYDEKSTFIFFDPPYYKQGKNLYLSFVHADEHERLANNIIDLKDYKWITTYDVEEKILELYKPYVQSFTYRLRYSANKKKSAKEYIFASKNTKLDSFEKVTLTKI